MTWLELLIATKNAGKVAEFRELIAGRNVAVSDLAGDANAPEVPEDGASFIENACIKASAYAKYAQSWALADDSGLSVDALGGKPGIHSARWAAMHDAGKGDADNNKLLVKQMTKVPDEQRQARFICALALADEKGRIVLSCQDEVVGMLLRRKKGTKGFGYDPLFLIPELGKTTAQLTSAEKHAISHRGKAMRRMVGLMEQHGLIGKASAPSE